MYLQHFGLNSKPFGATVEGAAVFLSPRQSEQIRALHQGLGAQDAVVAVTGPVGVGKTTFVNKGLELIHPGRLVASVGRMRLEPEDLFALLLSGFGISSNTKGTIRQIGAFRRYLHERAATGLQVAIVVEDAQRIGIDALVELEALTAADSGATSSANIILMGQPDLHDLLSKPDLARLKQRVRQRVEIPRLTAPEMQGYLKHAMRQAGGEYDSIFDEGVADIVAGCSEGIPRLINTLCDEALSAATEDNLARVTPELMAKIAESTLGYEAGFATPIVSTDAPPIEPETKPDIDSRSPEDDDIDWESPPRQQEPEPKPEEIRALEPTAVADLPGKPEIGHDIVVESGSYPAKTENRSEPLASQHSADTQNDPATKESDTDVFDAAVAAELATEVAASHIPDLINDTQPELRQLAEPADHATTLTDLEPVVATPEAMSAAAAEATESDSGDTQTIKTIADPDAALSTKDTAVEVDRDEDNSDYDLDDALAIDAESTNMMEALTPDLDSIATDKSAAETADTSSAELEPAVLPKDTELSSSEIELPTLSEASELPGSEPELPTLSNSMRVEVAKESKSPEQHESAPAAPERTDVQKDSGPQSAAAVAADTPDELDEEAAMAAELEMAYALEQQEAAAESAEEAAPQTTAAEPDSPAEIDEEAALAAELEMAYALEQQEAAAAESAFTDEAEPEIPGDTITGIFDNLDPLPDLDVIEQQVNEAQTKPLAHPGADIGEVTVTDLAVSAIAKKSKQDIGALEDALEAAKHGETSAPRTIEPQTAPNNSETSSESAPPTVGIPEITLDQSISSEQPKKAEFDKFAAEIGTANSLEDFSDAMAETLFGSEAFDQIAADVVANPPDPENSAIEEMDKQSPVKLDESDMPGAANDAIEEEVTELSLEETGEQAAVAEQPAAKVTAPKPAAPKAAAPKPAAPKPVARKHKSPRVPTLLDGGEVPLNESVAMRMDILNKMKNNVASMATENVELGESVPSRPAHESKLPKPESIEDQIDTSITQTLKAVDIARMDAEAAAEEKEEKKSGGLFSRFRKSS